jgi:DNA primase
VDQLKLARRFAPEVVAFLDGDRAGQQAAERAFPVSLDAGVWVRGAFLPEGLDPDAFVRKEGVAATRKLLEGGKSLAEFFLDRVDPGPGASLPERVRAADRVGQVIGRVDDPVMFNLLAKDAAQRLGVDEAVFRKSRGRGSPQVASDISAPHISEPSPEPRAEELALVEAMALDRGVCQQVAASELLKKFESAELARDGESLIEGWAADGVEGILDRLSPVVLNRVTAALVGDAPSQVDRRRVADDCMSRIEQRARRRDARIALKRVRQAEAEGDATELRRELQRSILVFRQRGSSRE